MTRHNPRVDRVGDILRAGRARRHLVDAGMTDPGPRTMTRSEYHRYRGNGNKPPAPSLAQEQPPGEETPVTGFGGQEKLNASSRTVLQAIKKLRRVKDDRGVGVSLAEATGLSVDIVNGALGHLCGLNIIKARRELIDKHERIVDVSANPEKDWWDKPPDIAAQILEVLAKGPVEDDEGKAGTILVEAIPSPWGSSHTRKTIKDLADAGKITRVVNGKRTYKISLAETIVEEPMATATRPAPKRAAKPSLADEILSVLNEKNNLIHQDELAKLTGTPREEVREVMRTLLAKGSIEVLNRSDGLFVSLNGKCTYGEASNQVEGTDSFNEQVSDLMAELAAVRETNQELTAKLEEVAEAGGEIDMREVADNLLEKVLGIISGTDEDIEQAKAEQAAAQQALAMAQSDVRRLEADLSTAKDDLEMAKMEIEDLEKKLAEPPPAPAKDSNSFDPNQRKLVAKIATRSRNR